MDTDFPKGSEWRRWDLHIHAPGTRLANCYGSPDDWQRFCDLLENSDVDAFGITDYFALDGFFAAREHFQRLYPDSKKVLFPNVELRLNESVNPKEESVNLHLLLRPNLTPEVGLRLLSELKTETQGPGDRPLACVDLTTTGLVEQATVTRDRLDDAIQATFGAGDPRADHVLLLVPSRGDGIRPARGEKRKAVLTDRIDAWTDAIFGRASDRDYFLRSDRPEDPLRRSKAKPVFGGCDAHSFDQLDKLLGKTVEEGDHQGVTTWVKADLTYEGLQQTLVEPGERVRIAPSRPDAKEPYKVISAVHFTGTDRFPPTVEFNGNLVSIIGSRSSGKSALLAYLAHAVDPAYTEQQQMAAGAAKSADELGPAAGMSWADTADISCTVEWGDANATAGKVIYIPQNSLFSISERPDEVARKIEPALYRLDASYEGAHRAAIALAGDCNDKITALIKSWFEARKKRYEADARLRDLGDKTAVQANREVLQAKISDLRKASSLTDEEVARYDAARARLAAIERELERVARETELLEHGSTGAGVSVAISTSPSVDELIEPLQGAVKALVDTAEQNLRSQFADAIATRLCLLASSRQSLEDEDRTIRTTNGDLFMRHEGLTEVDELVNRHAAQEATVRAIAGEESLAKEARAAQDASISTLKAEVARRNTSPDGLRTAFDGKPPQLEGLTFDFETGFDDADLNKVAERFNRQERSRYLARDSRRVDLEEVERDIGAFFEALAYGTQKLRQGVHPVEAAIDVLTLTKGLRFTALLDEDRIGGFQRSSMTPGKQALFALTLTLGESDEPWPLLIDQPEDDLDSRSIYEAIVPYLKQRKSERQILMVTHNANLAIGADSEQIVVANRHADGRENNGGRMFDYASGSLESSRAKSDAEPILLESCGIREHACEILDGGPEAFRKRRDKYRL